MATKKISLEFKFKDFRGAIAFVDKVAEIANHQNHHPDIYISYNKLRMEIWTHETNSVTEKDLKLAKEIKESVAS